MYIRALNKSSLYKGCLEPIVLQMLRENGRMYGFEITQRVKMITSNEWQITEGALYPLLHRLESEGLLEATMENIGNRVRKYYTLTSRGATATAGSLREVQQFLSTLQILFHTKTA